VTDGVYQVRNFDISNITSWKASAAIWWWIR